MGNCLKLKKYMKNPNQIVKYLISKEILNWLPDRIYIKLMYRAYLNKKLNLRKPKLYNEKLQWLKLNDRNPIYTQLVDKYEVRKKISQEIGEEYLIPLLGVYKSFDEIDFKKLPNQFVLKCTHDSGGLVICKDKSKFNKESARLKIEKCLKRNYHYKWREWPYKNVNPRIICEEYMVDESGTELKDYKFMCFNGKVKCLFVASNRHSKSGVKVDYYDLNWNIMNLEKISASKSNKKIKKPYNFEKMVKYAEILSKGIPFVRIDFYEINGKLYFGEITFYPDAGLEEFKPYQYNELLGRWIHLPLN